MIPQKTKIDLPVKDMVFQPAFSIPDFDDPERATAKIAQKVVLDLNDPHLLVDVNANLPGRSHASPGAAGSFKRKAVDDLTSDRFKRYNISNDQAYELLKENHQSKVRSTLSNLTVEHSMPALRLQYPFVSATSSTRIYRLHVPFAESRPMY